MNAREMTYDFKVKLNKIDSQKYRNLNQPEVDWNLNEAQEIFVKSIAQPRLANQLGFESNQRTINDIRTIVVNQKFDQGVVPVMFDEGSYFAALPSDFWFKAKIRVYGNKKGCVNTLLTAREVQHDDEHEVSPFDRSSFEWRRVNVDYNSEGLRIFTDKTFTITKVCFEYLKRPRRIHNAQDWVGGTYTALDGTVLTGTQSCELPEGTHREIVDVAVLIVAGNLSMPNYNMKRDKLNLTT